MLTREDDIDVHALHRQGWTISAIARHVGRDRKTVRAYLAGREAGVRERDLPDPFERFVAYAGQQSTWGDAGPRAGVVAAFDLATGGQRWRADLGDPVVGLFRGEGQLVAMQYGWKGGGPEPEITHSRELEDGISVITTVLFSSNGLAGIDPGTGAVRWREDLGEGWMTRYGTRIVHAGSPDHEFLR